AVENPGRRRGPSRGERRSGRPPGRAEEPIAPSVLPEAPNARRQEATPPRAAAEDAGWLPRAARVAAGRPGPAELQPDLRSEPRADTRSEPQGDMRSEPRADMRSEPRADMRSEPRADMRSEPRADMRSEPRADMQTRPAGPVHESSAARSPS